MLPPSLPPERTIVADFYAARSGIIPPLQWPTFAPPFSAGVEVAQSVLAETQSAILPLVPYLDTLRWVFIAVALGGIAITIYARLDDWKRGQR